MSAPPTKKKHEKTWQDFINEGKIILFGKDISKAQRTQLRIDENTVLVSNLLAHLKAPKYFKDCWEFVRIEKSTIFRALRPDLFYSRDEKSPLSKGMIVYYHTNPAIGGNGPGSTVSGLLTFLSKQKMISPRTVRTLDVTSSGSSVKFYFEQFMIESTKNSSYVFWEGLKQIFMTKGFADRVTFLSHLLADWMSLLLYSRVVSLGNPCLAIETCHFRINSGLPTIFYRFEFLVDAINERKLTPPKKINFDFLRGCFQNGLITLRFAEMIKVMPEVLVSSFDCLKEWNTKNKRNKLTEMLSSIISDFLNRNQHIIF